MPQLLNILLTRVKWCEQYLLFYLPHMLYFLTNSRFSDGRGRVLCIFQNNPGALFSSKHPGRARVEISWQYFLLYLYDLIIVKNILFHRKTVDIPKNQIM